MCARVEHGLVCWAKGAAALEPPPRVTSTSTPEPARPDAPNAAAASASTPAEPSNAARVRWAQHVAVPFAVGHGQYWTKQGHSSGTWFRFRAQATFGPVRSDAPASGRDPWAVGPYFDASWHPIDGERRFSMGAGAVGTVWLGRTWAVMPSLGWFAQSHVDKSEHGLAGGLFLGPVQRQFGLFAFPVGVRLEGRLGFGGAGERSLLIGGEFDSFLAVALPVAGYLLVTSDWGNWN
jgi:hypothetical protein